MDPTSTIINNLRFPGQYYDEETGLHYNWHRYYDPRSGRYLRVDPTNSVLPKYLEIPYPISLLLSERRPNYYLYTLSNPANYIDPKALYVGGIGLGAGGAVSGSIAPGFFGSISLLYVNDSNGNEGIVLCGGGGIAAGSGVVAGLQTSHLWGVDSICDLEKHGFSLSFDVGGGAGPGISADIGRGGINITTGVGYGGYSGTENVISGCKLLVSLIGEDEDIKYSI